MLWSLWSVVTAFWYLFLTAAIAAVLAFAITFLHARPEPDDGIAPLSRRLRVRFAMAVRRFPEPFAVALIGALIGGLGGGSRESVVGDLLPAVLALLGGAFAYYVSGKTPAGPNVIRNSQALALGFFALYSVAAVWRQSAENFQFCKEIYSNGAFNTPEARVLLDRTFKTYCDAVFAEWSTPADR